MCVWCGDGLDRLPDFSIAGRPAEALDGLLWEGSFAEAAAGGVRATLERMQRRVASRTALFSGPIVGISWNERTDGFRYFVGHEADSAAAPDAGLSRLELPAMRFVTAWHAEGDGAVVEHYRGMLHWMQTEGIRRDVSRLHHREEYPVDADFSAPPVLRLMMPVDSGAAERIGGAGAGRFIAT